MPGISERERPCYGVSKGHPLCMRAMLAPKRLTSGTLGRVRTTTANTIVSERSTPILYRR
eukprot:scaffold266600_cov40-Tisochrysis_lutea.AAC.2